MSTRYLEIDSTYRNRNEWPLAGEFEIPISQSGRKTNGITALDPVSLSTPIVYWTSNKFNTAAQSTPLTGVVTSILPISNISSAVTFIVTITAGSHPQQLDDYYAASIIVDTTISEFHRIDSYKYIGYSGADELVSITVINPFGSTFALGNSISISDPTDINITNPQFFVPGGRNGNNAYNNCYLYNETTKEYREIKGFVGETHLLEIDTTNPISTWSNTDNYSIRKIIPLSFGPITSSTVNTVVIPNGSSENDFYNGQFIRIPATSTEQYDFGTIVPPIGEMPKIIRYNGSTRTATFNPPLSASISTLTNPYIEIMPFSYDNLNPFVYTGSTTSQQESVCYEIELLDLVLPNNILSVGIGSEIAFYPYVYVGLTNSTSPSGNSINTIYSNNPNSTKMLFRVPINTSRSPILSTFVDINGAGAKQTIKFKPNDNLKFTVLIPNGEIFDTITPEYFSPSAPNPQNQISALFAMKRISC